MPARPSANPALPVPTPAQLGYRMPAEWERHSGTWITWPHCEDTWPGKLDSAVPPYIALVDALRMGETVHINVLSEDHRDRVAERLGKGGVTSGAGTPVRFHVIPTEDEWIRDYGAIFLTRDEGMAASDWIFNSWGGKYPRVEQNNRVPAAMAAYLNVPRFEGHIVLEGGSVDVNGAGMLLTTESCLLHPNRNPGIGKTEIEMWLRGMLGVREILWLGDGIAGDDTDGHVDDITRFVSADTVVTVVEKDPLDLNYEPLRANAERLRTWRGQAGETLRIVELPMPAPQYWEGERLPASYANFYIGNAAVLLPHFDDPNDAVARETLQALFPDRRVVGVDCRDLVWGLGAFHCLTQQVPALPGR